LLKLNILITSFITTIVSLLICGVWDFPLTCLNLVNIIYWLGMTMAWHGKERWAWKWHGMDGMEWRQGNGMARQCNDMAMNGMAWKVKARQGKARKGMAWNGKARQGLGQGIGIGLGPVFQVLWMILWLGIHG
jgi:hypothetical protein